MASNLNLVAITGNLTRDPETRDAGSTTVTQLRVAVNDRRKQNEEWVDVANYFDVDVWGAHGENCAKFLAKGRPVAVSGRLQWREWETDGQKRQAVSIRADAVQFLGGRDDSPATSTAADTSTVSSGAPASDDASKIPFAPSIV